MRAVSCCALPRSRAVYARVCPEQKGVFRLKTARATSLTGPLCGCAVCLCNNLSCRSQRSNAVAGSRSKNALRRLLRHPSVLPALAMRVDDFSPLKLCPTQPKEAGARTRTTQEPTKPARVVAKLAALVVLASPPPVRAARHEAARRTPPARRTRCLLRAPPLESRRIKRPKAKGCPNAVAAPRKDEAVHGHAPRHAHQ